jgi:hypothetical protein
MDMLLQKDVYESPIVIIFSLSLKDLQHVAHKNVLK